jgi:hypothetical protein
MALEMVDFFIPHESSENKARERGFLQPCPVKMENGYGFFISSENVQ